MILANTNIVKNKKTANVFNAHEFQLPKFKGSGTLIINATDIALKTIANTIADSLLSIAAFSCSVLTYSQKENKGL